MYVGISFYHYFQEITAWIDTSHHAGLLARRLAGKELEKGSSSSTSKTKKIRGNSGISWRKYKLFSSRGEGWDEGGVWKASWRPLCTAGCFICILLLSRAGGRGDRLWIMNPLQASQAACRTPAAAAWTSKHPAVHRSKHDITCQLLQQCFSVLSISFRNCIIIVQ